MLLHLTVKTMANYEKALNMCKDHILNADNCNEIRTNLFQHRNEENKWRSNKEISKFYKIAGFKWKTMLNDPATKTRKITYGLKRVDGEVMPEIKR